MMRIALAALSAIPLAACMVTPSGQPGTGEPMGSCSNEGMDRFNGQPASQDLGAQMLRQSGARSIRWVPKGSVITMEFSADRLTVLLDGSNRVESARCG
jgi:hypothetical protein